MSLGQHMRIWAAVLLPSPSGTSTTAVGYFTHLCRAGVAVDIILHGRQHAHAARRRTCRVPATSPDPHAQHRPKAKRKAQAGRQQNEAHRRHPHCSAGGPRGISATERPGRGRGHSHQTLRGTARTAWPGISHLHDKPAQTWKKETPEATANH
jgi:hypothetical protein